jgi:hypothetical protein
MLTHNENKTQQARSVESTVRVILVGIEKRAPESARIHRMQVVIVAAHDEGLIDSVAGNRLSDEFALGLKWYV